MLSKCLRKPSVYGYNPRWNYGAKFLYNYRTMKICYMLPHHNGYKDVRQTFPFQKLCVNKLQWLGRNSLYNWKKRRGENEKCLKYAPNLQDKSLTEQILSLITEHLQITLLIWILSSWIHGKHCVTLIVQQGAVNTSTSQKCLFTLCLSDGVHALGTFMSTTFGEHCWPFWYVG